MEEAWRGNNKGMSGTWWDEADEVVALFIASLDPILSCLVVSFNPTSIDPIE